MLRSNVRRAVSCAVFALLSSAASATDFYVDVVNGNDANPGTSPGAAWQTLTFAAANAAQGNSHIIHVAPGTYSAATGEVFPLTFRGQHVVGDGGQAITILDGGGASAVVLILHYSGFNSPSPVASLRGLTLSNAAKCIDVRWGWAHHAATFTDLALVNAAGAGFALETAWSSAIPASFNAQLSRVRIEGCQQGITATGRTGPNTLWATDCVIRNNTGNGIDIYANTTVNLNLTRCIIQANGGDGLHALVANAGISSHGFGNLNASINDCLFAENTNGWTGEQPWIGTFSTTFTRCTLANNTAFGVKATGSGSANPTNTFNGTLVWGNGTDVSLSTTPTASFSQIGGADPLFRDPLNGDYRVNFGSPVIDAGNSSTPDGTLDIALVPRSIDGNLDTNERADIGCLEFRTLEIHTTGQQNTLLELEMFGPSGGSTAMWIGRGAFGAPAATPFGQFDMSAIANFQWFTFPTMPGPGFIYQRGIPPAPIFIGQTYSFQGLVTSTAAPNGAAWSNAVSFTIVP